MDQGTRLCRSLADALGRLAVVPLSPLPLQSLSIVGVLVCPAHVTDEVFVRKFLLARLALDIKSANGGVLSQTWQQHVTPRVYACLFFLFNLGDESGKVELLLVSRGRVVEAVVYYDHLRLFATLLSDPSRQSLD